jgi:hypothetical protein
MCFGAMQASKATKKNVVLWTLKMDVHCIDEKLLTIAVISDEND